MKLSSLPREEVLRYLGWKGTAVPLPLEAVLERCMEEALGLCSPLVLYKRVPILLEEDRVKLLGTPYALEGKDIRAHLSSCGEIFLLCVTVGFAIEREIRARMLTAPEEAVILDACATAAVEEAADGAEGEIAAILQKEGRGLTWRYSPGYGDLPLETQKWLIPFMDAPRKIGLSLTDSLLMTPSKSVSAILGVTRLPETGRESGGGKNPCQRCPNRETCSYRKRGDHC